MDKSRYKQKYGIDASKAMVRKIFKGHVDNDFPHAFVNILRDPDFPELVFTFHLDGDGSKFVQRILHFLVTGDAGILQGAFDDALSMNTGDIAAGGFVSGKMVLGDVINIGLEEDLKNLIMQQLAYRITSLLGLYRKYGFDLTYFLGGETADLPDQVLSVTCDMGIYARTRVENVVAGNVADGDVIYGFASDGCAMWEEVDNSGIMANGLTMGRNDLMHEDYNREFPFLTRVGGAYSGRYRVEDRPDELGGMSVSEALLSPTRQWAIVIKMIIDKLKARGAFTALHGISMNTGGGATKIGHVGEDILYEKTMPTPPPIFRFIQAQTNEPWKYMFRSFNCGIGIDVVGQDSPELSAVIQEVCDEARINVFKMGSCKKRPGKGNKIVLNTPYGTFDDYDLK